MELALHLIRKHFVSPTTWVSLLHLWPYLGILVFTVQSSYLGKPAVDFSPPGNLNALSVRRLLGQYQLDLSV